MKHTTSSVIIDSTSLAAAAYDEHQSLLQLRFQDGGCYEYAGVSAEVFHGLVQAESKGTYFNRFIRHAFPYAKLDQNAR